MLLSHHVNRSYGPRGIFVVIVADVQNVNLFTLAGSPSIRVDVTCIVASGVKVGSSSATSPAFRTGNFVSGSTIRLVNYGRIAGAGGNGDSYNANTVQPGGNAIRLDENITIDNALGQIFGGGGGGGRGGSGPWISARKNGFWTIPPPPEPYDPGDDHSYGPGGGGQGDGGGFGGAGDTGIGGSNASNGSASGPGNGAAGVNSGYAGGRGGYWGEAGATGAGEPGTGGWSYDGFGHWTYTEPGTYGLAGGAAGKAIDKRGNSITWLSGNDSTHVKGPVS